MRRLAGVIVLALGVTAGAAAERKILYYRDPGGAPYWSAEPKKDPGGRDYLPVHEDEEISFEPGGKKPHSGSQTRVNALNGASQTRVNAPRLQEGEAVAAFAGLVISQDSAVGHFRTNALVGLIAAKTAASRQ